MINPALYEALCRVFGQRNVLVVKQGQRGDFHFGLRKRVVNGQVEDYRTICKSDTNRSLVGEEFRVNCPFCTDGKHRLYINHLWGTKDRVTGSRYLWMANCWNEGCTSDFQTRKDLLKLVLEGGDIDKPLQEGREMKAVKADWPGEMWPIYDLAKRDPRHPAIIFAYARNWDLEELTREYDVRVVVSANYWEAAMLHRIVAPVYNPDKSLKTWTARRVVENDTPKWLHCPYVGTADSIYALSSARKCKVPRIVEGPADCWNHRGTSAAMLGKTLQPAKARRLAHAFRDAKAIALCLDPDQDVRSYFEGKPHHLDVAMDMLKEYTDVPIIRVEYPAKKDQGDLDYDVAKWHIERCADEQGIKIA